MGRSRPDRGHRRCPRLLRQVPGPAPRPGPGRRGLGLDGRNVPPRAGRRSRRSRPGRPQGHGPGHAPPDRGQGGRRGGPRAPGQPRPHGPDAGPALCRKEELRRLRPRREPGGPGEGLGGLCHRLPGGPGRRPQAAGRLRRQLSSRFLRLSQDARPRGPVRRLGPRPARRHQGQRDRLRPRRTDGKGRGEGPGRDQPGDPRGHRRLRQGRQSARAPDQGNRDVRRDLRRRLRHRQGRLQGQEGLRPGRGRENPHRLPETPRFRPRTAPSGTGGTRSNRRFWKDAGSTPSWTC